MRHLEQRALALAPDLVTVLYGWNDGWRSVKPDTESTAPGRLESIVQSSRAIGFTRRKFDALMRRVGLETPAQSSPVRVPRVTPELFEANLLRIAESIRRAGAIPVFLTAPAAFGPARPPDAYFRQGWMVPRSELEATRLRYSDATRRAAATAGVLLVDLARLMSADDALFLGDGYHPNQQGFQVMAELIVEAVRQATLIPRGR